MPDFEIDFKVCFGRLPRKFDPRVMHLSSLLGARDDIPPPPPSADYTKGITSWGMMLNDRLGDCTCAAAYHARQVWTANIGVEYTDPDAEVLALYEKACGYDPQNSGTDQGGVEQNVLGYLLTQGYPVSTGTPDKLLAFFEVDPRNKDDVKTVINECGLCYIGFDVPSNIDETPGSTWEVDSDASIEGGHAVVLVGYDEDTVTLISWGSLYKMTWDFFQKYTDEAYALVSPLWIRDGKTLLGLSADELSAMMGGAQGMTDNSDPDSKGNGKAWVTLAATFGTTYGMNYASLHGVNFEVLKIPSELVKSTLEAAMLGFFTWATPDHAVDGFVDSILWTRRSIARIIMAFKEPIQAMLKKPD